MWLFDALYFGAGIGCFFLGLYLPIALGRYIVALFKKRLQIMRLKELMIKGNINAQYGKFGKVEKDA